MSSAQQVLEKNDVYDFLGPHRFTPSSLSQFYEQFEQSVQRALEIQEHFSDHDEKKRIVAHEFASDLCSFLSKNKNIYHTKTKNYSDVQTIDEILHSYSQQVQKFERDGLIKKPGDVLSHCREYFESVVLEKPPEYQLPEHLQRNQGVEKRLHKYTFADVIGRKKQKETLRKNIINPIKKSDLWNTLQKIPEKTTLYKAVLFLGPPGTGKTYTAQALAGELGAIAYTQKGSDFVQPLHGQGKNNLEELYQDAAKHEHGLVIIDEADSLIRQRGTHGAELNVDTTTTLLDFLGENTPFPNVTTILSTNMKIDSIDYALRSRLKDGILTFDYYSVDELTEILKLNLSYYSHHSLDDKTLQKLAENLPERNGRAAKQVVTQAALLALDQGMEKIGKEQIEQTLEVMLRA